MTTNNVTKYLKFANVQMAAESLFVSLVTPVTGIGLAAAITDKTAMNTDSLKRGNNNRGSRFTDTLATDFLQNWQLVEHQTNTKSGFSGTLFKAISNDDTQGIRAGELVLSFRSTEFADDAVRDNQATNVMEIKEHGWAFGQIADMEAWYKSLRTVDSNGIAKIGVTDKVSVTGYSLGGHLATAFNILRREAGELSTKVMGTYTFNGAGVGEVQNNKKLTDVINQFEAYRNNGATFTDSVVSNVYNQLKAKLNTGSAPSSSDIELANSLLDQSAAIHARAKNVKEAQSVIDAITRVKRITDEATRVAGVTNSTGAPAQISTSNIDAARLDYQIGVVVAERDTNAGPTLLPALKGRNIASNPIISPSFFDIYGANFPSAVANSQYHYGEATPIFIEDQPLFRGTSRTEAGKETLKAGEIKLLVNEFSTNDFGDTHSLVLLVDSLLVQHTLAQLDSQLDVAALNRILLQSSNKFAESTAGQQGKAEGDVLENVVNSLGRMFGTINDSNKLVGNNEGGEWANTNDRLKLHEAIANIQNDTTFTFLKGNVKIVSSEKALARAQFDYGAIAALKALSPFMLQANVGAQPTVNDCWRLVPGEAALVDKWLADQDLTPAEREAGQATFSNEWLSDRAKMLNVLITRNRTNVADDSGLTSVQSINTDGGNYVQFRDDASATKVRIGVGSGDEPLRRQVWFGTSEDDPTLVGGLKDDSLYGMAGDDTLRGNKGDDYLEGGDGLDTYNFAKGDGQDTILDRDGKGKIQIGGLNKYNATRINENKDRSSFIFVDKTAGIKFSFKPISEGATKGELTLTRYDTTDSANIGGNAYTNPDLFGKDDQITIKNFDYDQSRKLGDDDTSGNALGIKLNNDQRVNINSGIATSASSDPANPFSAPRAATEAIVNNILNLPERAGSVINIAANFVKDVVSKFRVFLTEGLNTQGVNSEAAFMLVNGAEEIKFANGYVDIEIPAGQAQKYFQFISIGDIDANLTGGLKVALLDDSGKIATNDDGAEITSTLDVNVTAAIEDAQVTYTSTLVGDQIVEGRQNIDDTLGGTAENESVDGATGANFLSGGGGDDLLFRIGNGKDTAVPNASNMAMGSGGAGNDRLYVNDKLTSGQLRQQIIDDATDRGTTDIGALLYGGSGNDLVVGGSHQDFIHGGSGNDRLNGGGGDDVMVGDNVKVKMGEKVFEYGTETNDNSDGSQWSELIVRHNNILTVGEEFNPDFTLGGNDTIRAGGGNDWVAGDGGNDTLYGEDGDDFLFGGHNDDTILGGAGDDQIDGDDSTLNFSSAQQGNDSKNKTTNLPIHAPLQAKAAETAGRDCTLRIHVGALQHVGARTAANDIHHARAA